MKVVGRLRVGLYEDCDCLHDAYFGHRRYPWHEGPPALDQPVFYPDTPAFWWEAVQLFMNFWRPVRDGRGPHYFAVHVGPYHIASVRKET